jgi:hypothetical protein
MLSSEGWSADATYTRPRFEDASQNAVGAREANRRRKGAEIILKTKAITRILESLNDDPERL